YGVEAHLRRELHPEMPQPAHAQNRHRIRRTCPAVADRIEGRSRSGSRAARLYPSSSRILRNESRVASSRRSIAWRGSPHRAYGPLPLASRAVPSDPTATTAPLTHQEATMPRTTQAKKQWTVMVYLAGDNNLDGAGVGDLAEMKTVGSTRDISVVAQFDRAGRNVQTNRYFLQKGTTLAHDVVTSLGETDTGDPRVLRDFVEWAVVEHPAQRYMLVIWNHGAGWDDSNLYQCDYFSGTAPPVVRKGRVISPGRAPAATASVAMGTVRAAFRRGRRSLFGPTMSTLMSSRAIAFDDQAKDYLDN